MQVSFKFDKSRGFVTDTEGKSQIVIKNSITDNAQNFAPTELLLLAMGGCTSDDVLSILRKMKVDFESYRCDVTAERNEEPPRTVKRADIHYRFTGNVDPEKARKAIKLSLTKYCSVSILAKRGGADITYTLSINGNIVDQQVNPDGASPEAPMEF